MTITVTVLAAIIGGTAIKVPQYEVCPECAGKGKVEVVCEQCKGEGGWKDKKHVQRNLNGKSSEWVETWVTCKECAKGMVKPGMRGTGKISKTCSTCKGKKKVKKEEPQKDSL